MTLHHVEICYHMSGAIPDEAGPGAALPSSCVERVAGSGFREDVDHARRRGIEEFRRNPLEVGKLAAWSHDPGLIRLQK